ELAALGVEPRGPVRHRRYELELRGVVLPAVRHVHGRDDQVVELRLHDPRPHVERGVAEHGLHRRQVLADHERDARVRLEAVPVRVVVVVPALLRDLVGLRLQLLEAHDVRSVTLEPLADLRGPCADSIHVPGSDLHSVGGLAVGGGAAVASATCGLAAAATSADGDRGSRTVKRAPRPGPSLAASIAPPCSSTRSRAIERPSPRPPWRRVLPLSACQKRSKTCGRSPGSIPSPVSVTVSNASVSLTDSRASTTLPRPLNFTAFVSKFQTTCWRRVASPCTSHAPSSSSTRSSVPAASATGRTTSAAALTTPAR